MRIIRIDNLPITYAHGEVPRKAYLKVGESRTCVQTINYAWLEEGGKIRLHKHDDCEEFFLFLKGEGLMKVNDAEFLVKKGDFVVVEKGEWHELRNEKKSRLVFLTLRGKICS